MPTEKGRGWRSLGWVFRAAQVRLRFLAALAVAFLIVARWDVLRTYWDRWTSPMARDASMGAVSADTEYFCPMDPGVLSTWPGKCPICHMATVRRAKGDMGPLPSGVVARVQLSPDRVLLAGIKAETVVYRTLAREVRSVGRLELAEGRARVSTEVGQDVSSWLTPGQTVEVSPDPPDGSPSTPGRVNAIETASEGSSRLVIEVTDPPPAIRSVRFISILIRSLVADREPFRSMPQGNPPLETGDPRFFHTCADHPDVIRVEPGHCPKDERALDRVDLAVNQRLDWWCPMHPKIVADRAGSRCGDCGGMALVPRIVSYRPKGQVLAVAESAVIDTGSRTMVYVERMPGMFDGVEVRLGPRCGAYYPVVEGLEAGQAVASSGAFLVDAETRLNPSLAAGYFGAKRSEAVATKAAPAKTPDLGGLSPLDREQAVVQEVCPVTGKRLGSMGTPVRVVVKGRTVFLCCEGCKGAIAETPDRYLAKLKPTSSTHHP
jgi:membrane fusion protein, copper/silver efflux system